MTDELLPRRIDRQQAVVLDILVDQPQNQSLTHDGSPKAVVTVAAHAEPLALVVVVGLDQRVVASDQHIDQIVGFELIAYGLKHLQHQLHRLHALETRLRMQTVVAASAILLRKLLSEIVQQRLAPANRALGIRDGLLQQQATDLLFGQRLALHELLELLDILITVKRDAVPARSVAAGPARLLIIAFEALGNIVMDHVAHVGFVDTHAESDRRDDHIHLLVQKLVLIRGARRRVHTGVIGSHFDIVGGQQLRKLLDLLAAQAVDDARLALVALDVADDLLGRIDFRADFVKQVRAVERRLEHRRVEHAQVLLDIHLHLGRRGRRQRDQRRGSDLVDDRAYAAILRPEVVSPLRNAVRLVDRIERNSDFAQEIDIILLRKRLGGEIEQLGLALEHVALDFRYGSLIQRRVQKMGHAVLHAESPHRIHLVFHQRDQRRNDDRHPVHHQRGQLIAQRFAASRRHQHERILSVQHVPDNRLLISLETVEAEIALQAVAQFNILFPRHLSSIIISLPIRIND